MKKTLLTLTLMAVLLGLAGCTSGTTAEKPGTPYSPGGWSGDTFRSSFVGANFTLPQGWTRSTDAEISEMDTNANQALAVQKETPDTIEESFFYQFSAQAPVSGDGIMVLVQKTTATPETYSKAILSSAETSGYTMGETATVSLYGLDHLMLPLTMADGTLQRQYVRTDGAYAVIIMMFTQGADTAVFTDLEGCFAPHVK